MLVKPAHNSLRYLQLEIPQHNIIGYVCVHEFIEGKRAYLIQKPLGGYEYGTLSDKQAETIEKYLQLCLKRRRVSGDIWRLERELARLKGIQECIHHDLNVIMGI